MQAKVGQEVRVKGLRGLWEIKEFYNSPSQGLCAKLWRDGHSRIIPLDKITSKSRRPLEKGQ